MEIKGKILAKKGDNKAFKLDDGNWYNLNAPVIPYLEKMSKGDFITVIFEKKGVSRYVSKIYTEAPMTEKPEETKSESSTGFACEECGKELKDNRFKKCYMCNKKSPKKEYKSYDNPEKTAQIQRGNALNAAATVASSQQFADPEVAKQFTLLLAEDFLLWLRGE